MIAEDEHDNLDTFRDCLSTTVIQRLTAGQTKTTSKRRNAKGRKNQIKPVAKPDEEGGEVNDAAELAEFVEYLAEEIFTHLPLSLRSLSYANVQDDPGLGDQCSTPLSSDLLEDCIHGLPTSVLDSITTYALIDSPTDLDRFLDPTLTAYIENVVASPKEHTPSTRADECEICGRDWVPLTYHHLIPRQMHGKAVKRGWCKEWELAKVAWLCRACHSFVHRVAGNEELARQWADVGLLMEREDVKKWAAWVGGVRWKSR